MTAWLVALGLTVAVELPIAAFAAGAGRRVRAAGDSVPVNLLTQPLATWAFASGAVGWWAAELAVVAVEVLVYRAVTGLSWRRAALVALPANAASAALS